MKLPKLARINSQGFSHIAAPLAVIVLVATAGVYTLVASHADTCGTTSVDGNVTTSGQGPCPKKVKPRLKVLAAEVTPDDIYVEAQLVNSKGYPVPKDNCSGSVSFDIKTHAYIFKRPNFATAAWYDNACSITYQERNMHNKRGTYVIKITYHGNSHYKAVSKTVKTKQTDVSYGMTEIAP